MAVVAATVEVTTPTIAVKEAAANGGCGDASGSVAGGRAPGRRKGGGFRVLNRGYGGRSSGGG